MPEKKKMQHEPKENRLSYTDAGIPLNLQQGDVLQKKEFQSYKELEDMEIALTEENMPQGG